MNINLGVYIPMYGGWLKGIDEGEEDPTFNYAAATAIRAEEIGFDSIWVPDHMLNRRKEVTDKALEAWTTLSAIAALTKRVELFHTVLCQGFRYPAVLAKMCATLDDVSQGRFRLGIGAGSFEREFKAYGVPWHDHDARIERAREQIEIIKSLWTQPITNYKGRFYEIIDGILEPKPIQKPHPPIWWAGRSEKSRQLVADLADGWVMGVSTLQEAEKNIQDMKERLEAKGRKNIHFQYKGWIYLGKTDDEAKKRVTRLVGDNSTLLENILTKGFVGSPETVAEKIQHLSELGFDHVTFQISPALKALEELEEKLIPIL